MTTQPVSGTDSSTTIQDLRTIISQFVAERDWQKFHDIKNLSMSLAIEAAELMEHSQWLTTTQAQQHESLELSEVAEELADVLSYTLAIANVLQIDLSSTLQRKMIKNRQKYPIGGPNTELGKPTN